MNQPTDLELMIAVQQGEVGGMGTLFERHHERIYNFCLRMTGSPAASEDLVQEAFMRALKYRQTFRGDADFLPWLYRLARNVCNDHFHKNQRFPITGEDLARGSVPTRAPSTPPNRRSRCACCDRPCCAYRSSVARC